MAENELIVICNFENNKNNLSFLKKEGKKNTDVLSLMNFLKKIRMLKVSKKENIVSIAMMIFYDDIMYDKSIRYTKFSIQKKVEENNAIKTRIVNFSGINGSRSGKILFNESFSEIIGIESKRLDKQIIVQKNKLNINDDTITFNSFFFSGSKMFLLEKKDFQKKYIIPSSCSRNDIKILNKFIRGENINFSSLEEIIGENDYSKYINNCCNTLKCSSAAASALKYKMIVSILDNEFIITDSRNTKYLSLKKKVADNSYEGFVKFNFLYDIFSFLEDKSFEKIQNFVAVFCKTFFNAEENNLCEISKFIAYCYNNGLSLKDVTLNAYDNNLYVYAPVCLNISNSKCRFYDNGDIYIDNNLERRLITIQRNLINGNITNIVYNNVIIPVYDNKVEHVNEKGKKETVFKFSIGDKISIILNIKSLQTVADVLAKKNYIVNIGKNNCTFFGKSSSFKEKIDNDKNTFMLSVIRSFAVAKNIEKIGLLCVPNADGSKLDKMTVFEPMGTGISEITINNDEISLIKLSNGFYFERVNDSSIVKKKNGDSKELFVLTHVPQNGDEVAKYVIKDENMLYSMPADNIDDDKLKKLNEFITGSDDDRIKLYTGFEITNSNYYSKYIYKLHENKQYQITMDAINNIFIIKDDTKTYLSIKKGCEGFIVLDLLWKMSNTLVRNFSVMKKAIDNFYENFLCMRNTTGVISAFIAYYNNNLENMEIHKKDNGEFYLSFTSTDNIIYHLDDYGVLRPCDNSTPPVEGKETLWIHIDVDNGCIKGIEDDTDGSPYKGTNIEYTDTENGITHNGDTVFRVMTPNGEFVLKLDKLKEVFREKKEKEKKILKLKSTGLIVCGEEIKKILEERSDSLMSIFIKRTAHVCNVDSSYSGTDFTAEKIELKRFIGKIPFSKIIIDKNSKNIDAIELDNGNIFVRKDDFKAIMNDKNNIELFQFNKKNDTHQVIKENILYDNLSFSDSESFSKFICNDIYRQNLCKQYLRDALGVASGSNEDVYFNAICDILKDNKYTTSFDAQEKMLSISHEDKTVLNILNSDSETPVISIESILLRDILKKIVVGITKDNFAKIRTRVVEFCEIFFKERRDKKIISAFIANYFIKNGNYDLRFFEGGEGNLTISIAEDKYLLYIEGLVIGDKGVLFRLYYDNDGNITDIGGGNYKEGKDSVDCKEVKIPYKGDIAEAINFENFAINEDKIREIFKKEKERLDNLLTVKSLSKDDRIGLNFMALYNEGLFHCINFIRANLDTDEVCNIIKINDNKFEGTFVNIKNNSADRKIIVELSSASPVCKIQTMKGDGSEKLVINFKENSPEKAEGDIEYNDKKCVSFVYNEAEKYTITYATTCANITLIDGQRYSIDGKVIKNIASCNGDGISIIKLLIGEKEDKLKAIDLYQVLFAFGHKYTFKMSSYRYEISDGEKILCSTIDKVGGSNCIDVGFLKDISDKKGDDMYFNIFSLEKEDNLYDFIKVCNSSLLKGVYLRNTGLRQYVELKGTEINTHESVNCGINKDGSLSLNGAKVDSLKIERDNIKYIRLNKKKDGVESVFCRLFENYESKNFIKSKDCILPKELPFYIDKDGNVTINNSKIVYFDSDCEFYVNLMCGPEETDRKKFIKKLFENKNQIALRKFLDPLKSISEGDNYYNDHNSCYLFTATTMLLQFDVIIDLIDKILSFCSKTSDGISCEEIINCLRQMVPLLVKNSKDSRDKENLRSGLEVIARFYCIAKAKDKKNARAAFANYIVTLRKWREAQELNGKNFNYGTAQGESSQVFSELCELFNTLLPIPICAILFSGVECNSILDKNGTLLSDNKIVADFIFRPIGNERLREIAEKKGRPVNENELVTYSVEQNICGVTNVDIEYLPNAEEEKKYKLEEIITKNKIDDNGNVIGVEKYILATRVEKRIACSPYIVVSLDLWAGNRHGRTSVNVPRSITVFSGEAEEKEMSLVAAGLYDGNGDCGHYLSEIATDDKGTFFQCSDGRIGNISNKSRKTLNETRYAIYVDKKFSEKTTYADLIEGRVDLKNLEFKDCFYDSIKTKWITQYASDGKHKIDVSELEGILFNGSPIKNKERLLPVSASPAVHTGTSKNDTINTNPKADNTARLCKKLFAGQNNYRKEIIDYLLKDNSKIKARKLHVIGDCKNSLNPDVESVTGNNCYLFTATSFVAQFNIIADLIEKTLIYNRCKFAYKDCNEKNIKKATEDIIKNNVTDDELIDGLKKVFEKQCDSASDSFGEEGIKVVLAYYKLIKKGQNDCVEYIKDYYKIVKNWGKKMSWLNLLKDENSEGSPEVVIDSLFRLFDNVLPIPICGLLFGSVVVSDRNTVYTFDTNYIANFNRIISSYQEKNLKNTLALGEIDNKSTKDMFDRICSNNYEHSFTQNNISTVKNRHIFYSPYVIMNVANVQKDDKFGSKIYAPNDVKCNEYDLGLIARIAGSHSNEFNIDLKKFPRCGEHFYVELFDDDKKSS